MLNRFTRRRLAEDRRQSSKRLRRRRLQLEQLEIRLPLAAPSDLAVIEGRVFADAGGDGYTAGEELPDVALNLYRDNGNGQFDPATDLLVASGLSGDDGIYRFESLTAGAYFVQQPAQSAGGQALPPSVSPLINISADDAAGQLLTVIDSFDAAPQLVFDDTADGVPVTSSVQGPTSEILGGERDILVNKTSVNGRVQISVNDPLLPGYLSFDSIQTGQGQRIVSWDGPDGDALTIDDTGLGEVDLTSAAAATGLRLEMGADSAAGFATIRIYSDDGNAETATRFSTAVVPIPETGGEASALEFVPFTAFVATSGGGADFTRVGAIELEITGAANVNGAANLVGATGPTVNRFDFNLFRAADLSLTLDVDDPTPPQGNQVTFTLAVANDGPDQATGVAVRGQLPAGLQFVAATPSQGSYDAATGIWTIDSLADQAAATLQLVASVQGLGPLSLTAEIIASDQFDPNSTPGNNDPTEDDQASVVITTQAADLALAMVVDQPAPQVGDLVRLTVTVDNSGPNDATGVAVAALLPAGLTFVSSSPSQGTYAAESGRWEIGEIAAGGEVTLELEAHVQSASSLTMTAQVAESEAFDPDSTPGNDDPTEDDQASVVITPQAADLALLLTIDQPAPNVGEVVRLAVTVDNAGPNAAAGVVVAALLPAGLTFIASSPSQGTYAADTGRWEIGEISAGSEVTLELEARVQSAGSLAMTAQVAESDAFDPDSTPGNDDPTEDDQDSVVITPQTADLALDLAVDQPAPNVGDEVRLTLTVNNSGPDAATAVVVEALLPGGLTFVSSSPAQGTYAVETGRWEIGTIAAGDDVVLELLVRIEMAGALALTAQVAESATFDPDSTPGNDNPNEDDQASVVITTQAADLALDFTVDQPAPNVGDVVRLTVTVDNSGPDAATGVVVAAWLPAGLTFVSSSPSQGIYAADTGRWEIGVIVAGDAVTLELEARVDSAEALAVTAQVAESEAFDPDSTPGNDDPTEDDQASVVIAPQQVDLSLTMAVDQPRPLVGQEVTFTLTLANDGPDAGTAIAVRDVLPTGLSFVNAVASGGEYSAASGLWTLDSLAAGATATLQLIARYDAPVTLTNVAEVVAVDQFDIDSTPDNGVPEEDDLDAVTIEPATADLSLSKSVDNAAPYLGQSVTFTIVVANAGPDAATGVSVLDVLADGLAFVSATANAGTYEAATGIWTIGEIAADGAVTLELIATPTAATTVINVAEVLTADQFDPDSTPGNQAAEEDDQDAVAVTPQLIDLSLSKTINNARPNVGQSVTYVLALTNAGPSTATGVQVLDTLPTTTEFVSSSTTSGSFSISTGIWTPDPIAAGATATLTIIARVTAAGVATNTAEVMAADQPDVNSTPGNGDVTEDDFASVTFNTPIADLSLVHTVSNATPDRDERVTFTIVVTNSGPDEATGVEVTHRLPTNFSYAKSNASTGIFTPTSGLWKIPTLASGSSATLTVTGRITNLAPVTSTAEITEADQVDPNSTPGNADPSEDDFGQVVVTPNVIDLAVTGSIDNLAPEIGDVVTLTFTVNNTGPATATGVALAAALPAGVTTLFHGATLGVFDPAKDLWTVGTLEPGESATLSLQLRVDTAGIKLATLQVVAADQFDIDSTPANNAADEDDQATVAIKAPRLLGLRMFLAR